MTRPVIAEHPAAARIPPMSPGEYTELADDIARNGLLHPIVTHQGQILDGRHRYRACLERDVEPVFAELPAGVSPLAYVLAVNVHRRHLNEGQRAMLVAELLPELEREAHARQVRHLKRGKDPAPANGPERASDGRTSRDEAGELAGVGGRTVGRAKRVLEHSPELAQEVADGKRSLHDAERRVQRSEVAAAVEQVALQVPGVKMIKLLYQASAAVAEIERNLDEVAGAIGSVTEHREEIERAVATLYRLGDRADELADGVAGSPGIPDDDDPPVIGG